MSSSGCCISGRPRNVAESDARGAARRALARSVSCLGVVVRCIVSDLDAWCLPVSRPCVAAWLC
eukprot:8588981-Alexandrium_andersonii.AAC.1